MHTGEKHKNIADWRKGRVGQRLPCTNKEFKAALTQGQKTDNAQMKNSWIKQLRGPPGKDEGEVERIVPVAGEVGQADGEKA